MKTPFVMAISFLLLAFAAKPLVGSRLHDINGDDVRADQEYYVLESGNGRGLTTLRHRGDSCPLDVAQVTSAPRTGKPLKFKAYNSSRFIYEAVDLNVKFSIVDSCSDSLVWKVDNYDEERGKWFITTGGNEGDPGAKTLLNWFKFERIGTSDPATYRIVYCPSVCASCLFLCQNVGVSFEDSARRLVLKADYEPVFPVVIFPAEGAAKCES
ncbi:Kunitz trypsin inhibitor 5 [Citrus sinensis]|nr:kunitz trypsin inhibitor 5-like [Citrus sinensis]KAH9724958.1 Kunitz trypsin inhibitor 5 [Citrus sinensis]KDO40321.1 hypothetical protein CISIN_1g028238mg [Citrus sinensis]GAY52240.1 hypothetical protein CUMW_140380 [Citrus unshiu]